VERLDPKLVRDIMGRKNVNMNDIPILLRKLQEEKQKDDKIPFGQVAFSPLRWFFKYFGLESSNWYPNFSPCRK